MATPAASTARERAHQRRSGRRRGLLRWLAGVIALGVVFFVGLAVGRAMESVPAEGSQTVVRTLLPTTLAPRQTVTVTVSKP